ncbi:hypothetical protein CR513_39969, partial [Mucuna pruriens]
MQNKVKLVVHGYFQWERIDFTRTFTLVTSFVKQPLDFESDAFPNYYSMDSSKHLVLVKQVEDEIYIHQSKYVNELLKKFNLEDCKIMSTLMYSTFILSLDETDKR